MATTGTTAAGAARTRQGAQGTQAKGATKSAAKGAAKSAAKSAARKGAKPRGADAAQPYSDPALRERLKGEILAGDKGGRPGQWSARKAQLLAHAYEAAGGGYVGGPTEAQQHLLQWEAEEWTTADGRPARRGRETARYLPKAAWEALSPAERAATDRKKRAASREGEQFVANTERAATARRRATAEQTTAEPTATERVTAKRATAKRATAKRATAKKATAKKATAKKATAKRSAARSTAGSTRKAAPRAT